MFFRVVKLMSELMRITIVLTDFRNHIIESFLLLPAEDRFPGDASEQTVGIRGIRLKLRTDFFDRYPPLPVRFHKLDYLL
jgi:hypothetical protein